MKLKFSTTNICAHFREINFWELPARIALARDQCKWLAVIRRGMAQRKSKWQGENRQGKVGETHFLVNFPLSIFNLLLPPLTPPGSPTMIHFLRNFTLRGGLRFTLTENVLSWISHFSVFFKPEAAKMSINYRAFSVGWLPAEAVWEICSQEFH